MSAKGIEHRSFTFWGGSKKKEKKELTAGSSLAINTELNGVTVLELEWFAVLGGGVWAWFPPICLLFVFQWRKESKPLFTRKTETHGIQESSTLTSGVSNVELKGKSPVRTHKVRDVDEMALKPRRSQPKFQHASSTQHGCCKQWNQGLLLRPRPVKPH